MAKRQKFWSLSHGFRFGRKLGDWRDDEEEGDGSQRAMLAASGPSAAVIGSDGKLESFAAAVEGEEVDPDLQEAIRLSLMQHPTHEPAPAAGAAAAAAVADVNGDGDDDEDQWEDANGSGGVWEDAEVLPAAAPAPAPHARAPTHRVPAAAAAAPVGPADMWDAPSSATGMDRPQATEAQPPRREKLKLPIPKPPPAALLVPPRPLAPTPAPAPEAAAPTPNAPALASVTAPEAAPTPTTPAVEGNGADAAGAQSEEWEDAEEEEAAVPPIVTASPQAAAAASVPGALSASAAAGTATFTSTGAMEVVQAFDFFGADEAVHHPQGEGEGEPMAVDAPDDGDDDVLAAAGVVVAAPAAASAAAALVASINKRSEQLLTEFEEGRGPGRPPMLAPLIAPAPEPAPVPASAPVQPYAAPAPAAAEAAPAADFAFVEDVLIPDSSDAANAPAPAAITSAPTAPAVMTSIIAPPAAAFCVPAPPAARAPAPSPSGAIPAPSPSAAAQPEGDVGSQHDDEEDEEFDWDALDAIEEEAIRSSVEKTSIEKSQAADGAPGAGAAATAGGLKPSALSFSPPPNGAGAASDSTQAVGTAVTAAGARATGSTAFTDDFDVDWDEWDVDDDDYQPQQYTQGVPVPMPAASGASAAVQPGGPVQQRSGTGHDAGAGSGGGARGGGGGGGNQSLEQLFAAAEEEEEHLKRQQSRASRHAEVPTPDMYGEVQELLQLFGLPFIVAPIEAEAQCAWLEEQGLVDGVVTNDNDAFLFGARHVYRNIFENKKYVEEYRMDAIATQLGLTRERLVELAMLLGSDYCPGCVGVGPVNAAEVVRAFPGVDGLKAFKQWVEAPDEGLMSAAARAGGGANNSAAAAAAEGEGAHEPASRREFKRQHRTERGRWVVPANFPDMAAYQGYIEPRVDQNKSKFTYGRPDMQLLTQFCGDKFGWEPRHVHDVLDPVLKEYDKRDQQQTLDRFVTFSARFAKIKSKRLQAAVRGLAGGQLDPEMVLGAPDGDAADGGGEGGGGGGSQASPAAAAAGEGRKSKRRNKGGTSVAATAADGDGDDATPPGSQQQQQQQQTPKTRGTCRKRKAEPDAVDASPAAGQAAAAAAAVGAGADSDAFIGSDPIVIDSSEHEGTEGDDEADDTWGPKIAGLVSKAAGPGGRGRGRDTRGGRGRDKGRRGRGRKARV